MILRLVPHSTAFFTINKSVMNEAEHVTNTNAQDETDDKVPQGHCVFITYNNNKTILHKFPYSSINKRCEENR